MKGLRKKGYGVAALKIDIAKAYDRLKWDYSEAVLLALGFADRWVRMIMFCVKTVSYNVFFNDEVIGLIHPGRGLQQGDPISPYLFILAAEGLSRLIGKKKRRGLSTAFELVA